MEIYPGVKISYSSKSDFHSSAPSDISMMIAKRLLFLQTELLEVDLLFLTGHIGQTDF